MQDFLIQCNKNLLELDENIELLNAKKYIHNQRGIGIDTCREHLIGYCKKNQIIPDEIKFFADNNQNNVKKWDLSYNLKERIIVPIFDEFGSPVAFATKKCNLEKNNPWWNLPSPFKKSNHLFLLNKSKKDIFLKNKVYVVEGYIDALTLYQNGCKNVVAIMGTAYTLRKIALTARYCNNVCLCFDSDVNGSGDKAKNKAIAILNKYSFCDSISVIDSLPLKEDPASFVSKHGIEAFLNMERVLSEKEIQKTIIDYTKK